MTPDQHQSYPDLSPRQREAINEVWDDLVVPALEEARTMVRRYQVSMTELVDVARAQRDDALSRAERAERELWARRAHGGEA